MTKQDITLFNSPVRFIDETDTNQKEYQHTYWLGEKQLQGITSTILVRALGDPYAAMSNDPVALANRDKAAQRGSNIHDDVRTLCNFGGMPLTLEGRNFVREFDDRGWIPVANEYVVSDHEQYASSIDLLFLDEKGDLCIGDLKTYSAATAKQQIQRVALQCAIYNLFFSAHNPYEVKHHYEIRLRENEVDIIELPMINPQIVEELLTACRTGDEKYVYNPTPDWYFDVETELQALLELKAYTDHALDEMKGYILERMEKEKLKTLRNHYTVSVVNGRTTTKVDAEKFKKDHPEMAIDFMVQTFDDKAFKKAAKSNDTLSEYITETTGSKTIRIA